MTTNREMVIMCVTFGSMLDVVHGLVQRGLTFKCYYDNNNWVIELTGGY